MDKRAGTLYFFCGRLAAGKTTLARKIAAAESAVFFCEDIWLSKLSPGIRSLEDYLDWSRRCHTVMEPLIIQILKSGSSVVLDFAGNTVRERKWVRSLFEAAGSDHVLHYLDVPEEVCLAQLMDRNKNKPEGLYFASTTEEEFRVISEYFQPPAPEEGFNLQTKIVH
jgi:predicted kinase